MGHLCKSSLLLRSAPLLRRYPPSPSGTLSLQYTHLYIRLYISIYVWNSISSDQVRARIEVAVLNFLKILNSPTPAISDLSLVCNILRTIEQIIAVVVIAIVWVFCYRSIEDRAIAEWVERCWLMLRGFFSLTRFARGLWWEQTLLKHSLEVRRLMMITFSFGGFICFTKFNIQWYTHS